MIHDIPAMLHTAVWTSQQPTLYTSSEKSKSRSQSISSNGMTQNHFFYDSDERWDERQAPTDGRNFAFLPLLQEGFCSCQTDGGMGFR